MELENIAEIYSAQIDSSTGFPYLLDPRSLRVTQNAYFSLLTHTKKLLLVTFCETIAEIGVSFRTHGNTDGWTDRRDS